MVGDVQLGGAWKAHAEIISALNTKIESLESNNKSLTMVIQQNTKALDNSKVELKQLRAENEKLKTTLKETLASQHGESATEMHNQNEQLRDYIEETKGKLVQLEQTRTNLAEMLSIAREESHDLQALYDKMEEKSESLQIRVKKAEDQMRAMSQEKLQRNERIKQLCHDKEVLRAKVSQLQTQNSKLRQHSTVPRTPLLGTSPIQETVSDEELHSSRVVSDSENNNFAAINTPRLETKKTTRIREFTCTPQEPRRGSLTTRVNTPYLTSTPETSVTSKSPVPFQGLNRKELSPRTTPSTDSSLPHTGHRSPWQTPSSPRTHASVELSNSLKKFEGSARLREILKSEVALRVAAEAKAEKLAKERDALLVRYRNVTRSGKTPQNAKSVLH